MTNSDLNDEVANSTIFALSSDKTISVSFKKKTYLLSKKFYCL